MDQLLFLIQASVDIFLVGGIKVLNKWLGLSGMVMKCRSYSGSLADVCPKYNCSKITLGITPSIQCNAKYRNVLNPFVQK